MRTNDYYLGNQKLKRTNVPINYSSSEIKEFLKCAKDPIYFTKKYVKIINVDRGIIPFELYDFQEDMLNVMINNRYSIHKLPRQSGKALDIETDIPTISGWKKMKDIQVGDRVFDMSGQPCSVTYKSETFYKPTYRITFSDKTTTDACEDHIWYGFDYHGTNKYRKQLREFTTKQIAETGVMLYNSEYEYRYAVPLNNAVQYHKQELPIDPYTLGLWLGDGTSSSSTLTMHEDDFNNIKHLIPYPIHSIHRYNKKNPSILSINIEGFRTLLRENNLLNNKHIPSKYLISAENQRRALLCGLMDTDGYTDGLNVSFTQCIQHEQLVESVNELICSLGYKIRRYVYNSDKPSITLSFNTHDEKVFCLSRKKDRQKLTSSTKCRKKQIISIELIETKPTQCISVDSPSHTYLCTKNYTVTHNTSCVVALMLWYTLFHENYSIAILANRKEQSQEILSRYQLAYENLPKWLQQGVVEWNKRSIELENGSKIAADATTGSAARGTSRNMIYLDEFAFVDNNLQDEFFASAFPVISSGNTTKVIMTSTPHGLNKFYQMWASAEKGRSEFVPFAIEWSDVPGRDAAWKEKQIENMGEEKFRQEFNTEFIGSSNTLIDPAVLLRLLKEDPLYSTPQIAVYEEPERGKNYVVICDVSRGVNNDYSAFTVINISTIPYTIAAKFRDNKISPMLFPNFIHQFATKYNEAFVLVEINDAGQQVADILLYELEYENMIFAAMKGRKGQQVSGGFNTRPSLGVRTTKQVKRIGCQNFKTLVETNQLILNDSDIIEELYSFVQVGDTYKADEGMHDDLVMTLVLFGWLSMQDYFKELTDLNIRSKIAQETLGKFEEDFLPAAFYTEADLNEDAPDGILSTSEFEKWLNE